MARTRMTLEEVAASNDVDRAKVLSATEEDIRRYMIEDGEDPDAPDEESHTVLPVAAIRARTGLTQDKFAKALRVPVKTLRNWEQGRTQPDPVAVSFFALVADNPERAFKIIARTMHGEPAK